MIRLARRLAVALIALLTITVPPALAGLWLLQHHAALDPGTWLQDPPAAAAPIGLAGAVAVALWLYLTTLIVRRAADRGRRSWRRLRHLPLPTPAQATAGTLAGTALLGMSALHTAADTSPAPPAAAGQQSGPPLAAALTAGMSMGVTLADGSWIPRHVAEDITAMASLFWLRRRQSYLPGAPDDRAGPAALSAAVFALTAPQLPGPTPATNGRLIGASDLPAGPTILTGPGADAAVRGLLLSALMTNTTLGDDRTRVTITAHDLQALLGSAAGDLPAVPGLRAVARPEPHPPGPLRGATEPDARAWTLQASSAPTTPSPPGPPHAATTIIVTAGGTTGTAIWQVATDGSATARGAETGRLCTLSPQTATDLLTFISQSHGLSPAATVPPPAFSPAPVITQPQLRDSGDHTPGAGEPATPPVRLTVLGDCRLEVGHTAVPIRRSAAWQALVLLATLPYGATSRHLITTIWPGLPPASITNRLYTTLSELRQQLKAALDAPVIVHDGDQYRLDPAVVDVDLWHLRSAQRAVDQALTSDERHRALRTLLEHHDGELAAGHTWPWLEPIREEIRRRVVDAYIELSDGLAAGESLALLRQAVDIEPFNEQLHQRTIDALSEMGDHTAAKRLSDSHTARLIASGLRPITGR